MIIDTNMYWFPEALFLHQDLMDRFLADLPSGGDTAGYIKTENGRQQVVIERPVGSPSVNYIQGDYELEGMCDALTRSGIDHAVMKIPCCQEWMSLEMCRLFNDGMADYQKRSGGKLVMLAVIPPFGSEESLAELKRCKEELGAHGIQLSAHYNGRYLDDPVFAPLLEQLNKDQMTAYIHHTPLPVEYSTLHEYTNLRRTYGRCNDQTIAVSRELMSGMFTKYPDLKVVHSMLGGGFFTYCNMFFPPASGDTANRFNTDNGQMLKHLQQNIFFEMSHAQPWGEAQLECAVKVLGADHILYGSSYPVRSEWLTEGPAFIKRLAITEEDKAKILHQNAATLYHI